VCGTPTLLGVGVPVWVQEKKKQSLFKNLKQEKRLTKDRRWMGLGLYSPNYLSPSNQTVDALDIIDFSCKIQGSYIDFYQLKIYSMSNALIFDSSKISLGSNLLYQDDVLTYSLDASTLTNGNQYFFTFTVFQSTLSATSRQTPFYCFSTPILTMTIPAEITSKKYSFVATYFQTEYISTNYFYMVFLNSDDEVILTTPNSYSGALQYEFDGFINNTIYKVYTVVVNQQNVMTQSITYTFTVNYALPSLTTIPTATLLPDLSATKINWSPVVQVTGSITGTSEYISGLFTPTNTGLKLDTGWDSADTVDDTITFDDTATYDLNYGGAILFNDLFGKVSENYVEFEVDIPLESTSQVVYIPNLDFAGGKMVRQENSITGDFYEVGYNPEIGCYYYNSNNFIVNGAPKEFIYSPILIAIKGIEVLIISNNVIYEQLHP